jgi:hypothetical protein
MSETPVGPRRNWRRRAIGTLFCLAPFALVMLPLVAGLSNDLEPFEGFAARWGWHFPIYAATIGMIVSSLICFVNLHLSFVRPQLYRRRTGSMEGFRSISGIPLIGAGLALVSAWIALGAWGFAIVGFVLLAADVGGPFWFLLATWSDSSLWDSR